MNDQFNENNNYSNEPVIIDSNIVEEAKTVKKKPTRGFAKYAALGISFMLLGAVIAGGSMCGIYNSRMNNGQIEGTETAGKNETDSNAQNSKSSTLNKATATSANSLTASEIYELACQQVVGISYDVTSTNMFGQESTGTASGTGFVITEDGYIVTNYHVVSSALSANLPIQVQFYDGTSYEARYVGGDSDSDVALLKIEAEGLSPVTLGDSNDMMVGEDVCVVGNALGELSYTLTRGLVSALDREIEITQDSSSVPVVMNMFQIDAAVNAGNSGGPAYNSKGEVIGVVTAKYSSSTIEGLGFAIPINDVTSIVEDLMEYGYVKGKAQMGVYVDTVDSTAVQNYDIPSGAYITGIIEGGAAEAAGIQAKDIITKVGDTEITSSSDLKSELKKYKAGETTTLTVYRSGQYLEIDVTFTEVSNTNDAETQTGQENEQQQSGGTGEPEDPYNFFGR